MSARSGPSITLIVFIAPLLASACLDSNLTPSPSNALTASSCGAPITVSYTSGGDDITLSTSEKNDLLMSVIGLIPSPESGAICEEDRTVISYNFSHPSENSTVTQHVRFEAPESPTLQKNIEQSILAKKTIDYIRDGQCEKAWDYLTPLIVAGSSEAAGILWAASTNVFSTGKAGENNGMIVTGASQFGVTEKGLELSLANASQPAGPNDVYTGADEVRIRVGQFMNIQLEDIATKTGCDFEKPSFKCRNLVIAEGQIDPLETYFDFLTKKNAKKYITCNRRI